MNLAPQRFEQAIALLKQLISCPSVSKAEEGTATIIEQFLHTNGVPAKRHLNNIWAVNRHYDSRKPSLLLNSHHDTVKPNLSYTLNPFDPIEQEGKLFGLGSNDAGGCLTALAACFLHFYERRDLAYNLVFAASAEEEISGKNGIEVLLPLLGNIDCALVGEPTLLQAAVAEKGLLVLDCKVSGISGHAARDEGDNALYKSLDIINWFRHYRFPKVSQTLGPVKMTVTQIEAGSQHNVVPDSCRFTVDIRVNDCYSLEAILELIKANVHCELTPRSMRLRSTTIASEHPLVQTAIACGCSTFGSSTLSDKALMPFPALKAGPGDSARSHTADEYIYLKEIQDGIEFYTNILNRIL